MSHQQNNEKDPLVVKILNTLMYDLGGPRIIQIRHIVNFFKTGTFFFCIFLMYHYNNYSQGAILYLILHGSYGIIWVLKDLIFPDKTFEEKCSFLSAILAVFVLIAYWVLPFQMMNGSSTYQNVPARILIQCCFMYIFGLSLMLCSDCQKYFMLKYQSKSGMLIKNGFFKYSRNPNYFGEVLIYASFGMLQETCVGWCILVTIWLVMFNLSMYKKDISLRKKHGWVDYERQSQMFLFQIGPNKLMSYICWVFILGSSVCLNNQLKQMQFLN